MYECIVTILVKATFIEYLCVPNPVVSSVIGTISSKPRGNL